MNAWVPALLQAPTKARAIAFVIKGQPASKANSRELVTRRFRDDAGQVRTRPEFIKSEAARVYVASALLQVPMHTRQRLTGPVRVTTRIFYASNRPDLDESLILDVLQDQYAKPPTKGGKRVLVQAGVYRNDRAVWSKRIDKAFDRVNPRTEVVVEPLTLQQCALDPGELS